MGSARTGIGKVLRVLVCGAGLLAALFVLAVAAVLVGVNTDPGRRLAERIADRATGGAGDARGAGRQFPGRACGWDGWRSATARASG